MGVEKLTTTEKKPASLTIQNDVLNSQNCRLSICFFPRTQTIWHNVRDTGTHMQNVYYWVRGYPTNDNWGLKLNDFSFKISL